MEGKDLKGLRYYIVIASLLLGFYTYSNLIGWKWFFSTPTEETRPEHSEGTHNRFYHK
jgi:hypothetical protein